MQAASDHGGVLLSVCKCRTASTEPNKTATPRMTKAAINMTRHSTAHLRVHACVMRSNWVCNNRIVSSQIRAIQVAKTDRSVVQARASGFLVNS